MITLSIAGDSDVPDGDGVTGIAEGGHPAVLFSTSFWSFSMAGFGLCGLLLQLFSATSASTAALMIIDAELREGEAEPAKLEG